MLTITCSRAITTRIDYKTSISPCIKSEIINSTSVMVNAEGKSLDEARIILANGINPPGDRIYTGMVFFGDEARKIIGNWPYDG